MKPNICVVIMVGSISVYGDVLTPPVINPANGHFYSLLTANTWTASQAEAMALGGNLVTIDNAGENDWVFDTFSGGERNLWIGLNDGDLNNVFAWADGSPVVYSNWDAGQPNLGTERWVFVAGSELGHALTPRAWHDVENNAAAAFAWIGPVYGVVEQTSPPFCSPHRARATAVVVNGTVVGANITDFGCGYTNAPLVLIQGGGGAGASATAILSNGVVSGINITSTGCCYSTNPAPKIVIASPPFEPSVGIRFSRVEVTQHVTLGRNYVLESSTNLVSWVATGNSFNAVSENYTNEFVIGETGGFFRLREVP